MVVLKSDKYVCLRVYRCLCPYIGKPVPQSTMIRHRLKANSRQRDLVLEMLGNGDTSWEKHDSTQHEYSLPLIPLTAHSVYGENDIVYTKDAQTIEDSSGREFYAPSNLSPVAASSSLQSTERSAAQQDMNILERSSGSYRGSHPFPHFPLQTEVAPAIEHGISALAPQRFDACIQNNGH